MLRLIRFFSLLTVFLTNFAYANADIECGATDEIRVSFNVSYFKAGSPLPGDELSTTLKYWAIGYVPQVDSASEKVGLIWFDNAKTSDNYLKLSVNFVEYVTEGKYEMTIGLGRKGSDGSYKYVMGIQKSVTKEEDLNQFIPDLERYIDNLIIILNNKFIPKKVKIKLSTRVINAESPVNPTIKAVEIYDSFGPIDTNTSGKPNFCFNVNYLAIAGMPFMKSDKAYSEKEFKAGITFKVTEAVDQSCSLNSYYCARPVTDLLPVVTKAFGVYWQAPAALFESDDEKLTHVCPLKVETPYTPELIVESDKIYPLPFKVTGYKEEVPNGLTVNPVKIDNESIGFIDPFGDLIDNNRITPRLQLHVKTDAPDQAIGYITGKFCDDVPDSMLGKDDNGKPIPWNVSFSQKVKVNNFPQIYYQVETKASLDKLFTHNYVSKVFEDLTTETTKYDAQFRLDFDVRFTDRKVFSNYSDEFGFRGTKIEYMGETIASLELLHPEATYTAEEHQGRSISRECGAIPFQYKAYENRNILKLNANQERVTVWYRHFIPAKNSKLSQHPLEGMGYMSKNMWGSPLTFAHQATDVDMDIDEDSCSVEYEQSSSPSFPMPIMISEQTPLMTLQFVDDCYGLEEVLLPLKEDEYMSALRLKLDDSANNFAPLIRQKEIELGRQDSAECWEVPSNSSRDTYPAELNRVKGSIYIKAQADLLRGKFNWETADK